MNIHTPLAPAIATWSRLKAELIEVYGLEPDDDALTDTLDGETELGDQIHKLLQHACEQELFAEALDKRITEYKARKERLNKAAKAIRQHVAEAALEAGMKKLPRPDMTVSFGLTKPALDGEASPDALPDDLVRVERKPNRSAIKEALESGREVPGYWLTNGRATCTVRLA
jgi:cation transport regulator ChaB